MKKSRFVLSQKLFLIAFLFLVKPARAQEMDMQHMHMSSSGKNVYLAMMDTMMTAMDKAPQSPLPTNDFMEQMIPHHEGAIAMAKYEIRHGKDFNMIQLAKSILQEQTNEVQQMRLWIKQLPVGDSVVYPGYRQAMDRTMNIMMENMPGNGKLEDTDRAFASVMIPHHQAAIDMAKVLLKYPGDIQVIAYAKHLISAEQVEIEQMSSFIN
ncbi:DUF305 domain-containing protein [Mucilaginibacter ginsenosidivorax]|nr:DUF305 domain-containing protein [Mucilaginibacter ginsenosidivorax]